MIKGIMFAMISLMTSNVLGQQVETLAAKYPNEYAVILQHTEEVKITVNNGVPLAETRISRQILILDDKANGAYNRYAIYHGSFDELKDIEAYTMPGGNRNEKIKISEIKMESATSRSVFYDDVKQSKFDFPALKKGAIAHVSYTILHKDAHMLIPFFVASYLPIVNGKYSVTYPKEIELSYTIRNNRQDLIKVQEYRKGATHSTSFEITDLEEEESFNDAPDFRYYEPHIIYRISSIQNRSGVKTSFLDTVDDLFKWNYSFIRDLENQSNPELRPKVDSIIGDATSEEEKARKIYRWVQQNIKYVAFENGMEGFVPRAPVLICNRRFGDCKDMASLLTAMLRIAGLNAYFAWIGTRSIPYDYKDVPLPIADNHMIAAVLINEKWTFLDGTDPGCLFGYPSAFTQGKQTMIAISEKEYKVVRVPEISAEKNQIIDSTFITLHNKGFQAKSRVYYYGYSGSDIYTTLLYKSGSGTRDYVKYKMGKASNNFILGNYQITNRLEKDEFMNINADFEVPEYGKQVANEIYINLNLEKMFTGNSIFDTAKRKVPSSLDQQFIIDQYTFLVVPEGYKVSYVPAGFEYHDEDLSFSIAYQQTDGYIVSRQFYKRKTLMIPPARFNTWNSGVRKILTQYKEQVVLQKK